MKKQIFLVLLITWLLITGCTETEQAVPTQTPAPEYAICREMENFRDCYVPEEELLNGSYWNWLNDVVAPTLVDEFKAREDKIKYVGFDTVMTLRGTAIMYDVSTVPNYEDPETAPFIRDVTFASTSIEQADGSSVVYYILPVFYWDAENQRVCPVITVDPIYVESAIDWYNATYVDFMNIPVIVYTEEIDEPLGITMTEETDPLMSRFYDRLDEEVLTERVDRFFEGDFSAFSGPDMLFLADIGEADFYK